MADLNDVYLAIGALQSDVKSVLTNQTDHQQQDNRRHDETQHRMDKLIEHVNHENQAMDKRITRIEDDEITRKSTEAEVLAHRKGMWKVIGAVGTVVAFLINGGILFFSGALNHWLGGS